MRVIYDLETYPNYFLCGIKPVGGQPIQFEISERRNDFAPLCDYVRRCALMIGFNNIAFDYPVLHHVLVLQQHWWPKVCSIFEEQTDRFKHQLRYHEMIVPQMDLFLIHHFDNAAKRTGLKTLQFNMRSESIEDLPIAPGTWLTPEQMDITARYNIHDLTETEKFYHHSAAEIKLREEIGPHAMNYNNTKIGKQFFIGQLPKYLCYKNDGSPRQTHRPNGIALGEIIFPYIRFESPEFTTILEKFKRWTIHSTKGGFDYSVDGQRFFSKEEQAIIHGFEFNFGLGGMHGSVKKEVVRAGPDEMILDIDVTSYYPSVAIANRLSPAHLGQPFVTAYSALKTERLKFPKGSSQNIQYKYGLNGVYGDSNNPYSVFLDPQFTMTTTINGQMMQCMLAERLMLHVPGLRLIQVNTDGLTIKFDKRHHPLVLDICKWWERGSCLDLEHTEYSAMWIRDVNNYIAQKTNGKLKRKGAYEYENLEWHKNHGCLIVPRTAEAVMIHGADAVQFLKSWTDPFDFFEVAKAPRGGGRMTTDTGLELTKSTRYYVSMNGVKLIAVHAPLKGQTVDRKKEVNKNKRHTICNRVAADFRLHDIDVDYYYQRVRKLIIHG